MNIHRTAPEQAATHASGWHPVSPDVEVLKIPLIDICERLPDGRPMFARLSHRDQEVVCRRLDATFVTMEIAKQVWLNWTRLEPVQLVTRHEQALQMRSREFCERHDERVWDHLETIGWDGGTPVANIGKFWLTPTTGNARNGGWFQPDGRPTQPGGPGSEHHDRDYTDYSQLGYLMRRRRPRGIVCPLAFAETVRSAIQRLAARE